MTASEAAAVSEAAHASRTSGQLAAVYEAIKKAASAGGWSLSWDGALEHDARKKLEGDGYFVKYVPNPQNETTYVISW